MDPISLAINAAVGIFAAGGTWAATKSAAERAAASGIAAHRRLDDHHERLIRLEERAEAGSRRVEEHLGALRAEQVAMRGQVEALRTDITRFLSHHREEERDRD